jgi:hypothetical protein
MLARAEREIPIRRERAIPLPWVVEHPHEAGQARSDRAIARTLRSGGSDRDHFLAGDEFAHLRIEVRQDLIGIEEIGPISGAEPFLRDAPPVIPVAS